jgi:pimeloyl-ACP methyl ester carboxylesterase
MSAMKRFACHLSVTIVAGLAALAPLSARQQAADDRSGPATFVVLVRGARIGSETVSLSRSANGWLISSSGRLEAPFDLVVNRFEVRYGADWQPQSLTIDGSRRGQGFALNTMFGLTTATSELTQGGQRASNAQTVSPRTIVLPSNFYAAYEALAARLEGAAPGARLPVFTAPEGEGSITVDRMTPRRIVTLDGTIEMQDWALTITQAGGPVPVELWTDARHRLARVVLPTASLVVLRDDLASVMVREERIHNAGDENAFIPANGFSLAATITKPVRASLAPAVVLVSGPGLEGRDHVVYGIPLYGQLAGRLADAGYFVVRYDPRGTGQSGGRTEAAALDEYAGDVRAVISWLRKRKDVDGKRIALVGYADSSPIAVLAASKDDNVDALALLASAGVDGRTAVMEQQEILLGRLKIPATEKTSRVQLQARLNEAAVTGRGWEGVPTDVRRQTDTPWFRSWLQFDPAPLLTRFKGPVLIVQGALDGEIAPANADRLESLAAGRKKVPADATRKVIVPGVNQLLVPATSASPDDYAALADRTVATGVTSAMITWLETALAAR